MNRISNHLFIEDEEYETRFDTGHRRDTGYTSRFYSGPTIRENGPSIGSDASDILNNTLNEND